MLQQSALLDAKDANAKLCGRCLSVKPLGEFRLVRRGSDVRHSYCRSCHNEKAREYRHRNRTKSVREFGRSLASKDLTADRAMVLVQTMIQAYGGLTGFITLWKSELDSMIERRPGSRMVLNAFMGITNLLAVLEERQPREPTARSMTDEQLETEIQHLLRELVGK